MIVIFLTFPEDVAVGKNKEDLPKIKKIDEIEDDDLILDIGPKTIKIIKEIIENSKISYYGMGQQVILKIQIIEKAVLKLQERLWKK